MNDYYSCPGCPLLRRENDELREHNRQLSDILFGLEDLWPKIPGVTGQMERLLRLLYKRKGVVTKELLYEVVCLTGHDPDRAPNQKIVDVQLCKLRQCLPAN